MSLYWTPERLRELRTHAHATTASLAAEIGFSVDAVKAWFRLNPAIRYHPSAAAAAALDAYALRVGFDIGSCSLLRQHSCCSQLRAAQALFTALSHQLSQP